MTITVEAVFKNGELQFKEPVRLAEGTPVRVTITPVDEEYDPLDAVIGICKNGPRDGADNHDKYIYGDPPFMIFVDTWAWVALASEEDQYHAAAQKAHRRLKKKRPRYVTTDYVLSEVITHLYRKQAHAEAQAFVNGLLRALKQGIHQLVGISPTQFDRAWDLRQKYDDKPDISFVDFTSMVAMQDLGITEVFTGDAHFLKVGLGFRLIP